MGTRHHTMTRSDRGVWICFHGYSSDDCSAFTSSSNVRRANEAVIIIITMVIFINSSHHSGGYKICYSLPKHIIIIIQYIYIYIYIIVSSLYYMYQLDYIYIHTICIYYVYEYRNSSLHFGKATFTCIKHHYTAHVVGPSYI